MTPSVLTPRTVPKPPLVLLPGWAHAAPALAPLERVLAARFEVGVHDGRPESARELLVARAGAEKAVLVGWSLGGLLAIELAAARRDLVRGLVLVGATPRFRDGPGDPPGTAGARIRALRAAVRRGRAEAIAAFLADCAAPERPLGDVAAEPPAIPPADVLVAGLDYLLEADRREACRGLDVPCRVLHGTEDRVVPVEAGRWLGANVPGGIFEEVRGCGHDLPLRRPELVLRAIEALVE